MHREGLRRLLRSGLNWLDWLGNLFTNSNVCMCYLHVRSDINTTKEREILIIMILCCSPKFGGLGREDILQVSKRTSQHFIAWRPNACLSTKVVNVRNKTGEGRRRQNCVTSVTNVCLKKLFANLHLPLNISFFFKRPENINVTRRLLQNTQVIALSCLSHTKGFCRPGSFIMWGSVSAGKAEKGWWQWSW